MKKIILALFLTGSMLAAQASNVKNEPKKPITTTIEKIVVAGKPMWELRFSCDGGNTWGTVCCFGSAEAALNDWEQNQDLYCSWT